MPALSQLTARRDDILRVATRHGATNVRVFGSTARHEQDADSDVDFLVDMDEGRSLLDLAGLHLDLEELLGCPVDVVSAAGLRSRLRERVLREAVRL